MLPLLFIYCSSALFTVASEMSRPPSPASSEASAVSEVDSLVGRPSDGPRLNWRDLGLPVPLEDQNAITALGCSEASSTSSRSRGRPSKRSSRRGDNFRKTPKGKSWERPRDEHGNFSSTSTTSGAGSIPAAPLMGQATLAPSVNTEDSTPSRGRQSTRSTKQGDHLRKTPKSKRGLHLHGPDMGLSSPTSASDQPSFSGAAQNAPSSRKSKRALNLSEASGRILATKAGDSAGRGAVGSMLCPGGAEGPDGASASSPPSATLGSTRATSASSIRASHRNDAITDTPSETPRAGILPPPPQQQQQVSSTPSTPSRSRGRPSERSNKLSATPKSQRGAHLNRSTVSSDSSTSRDSSDRFSSARKQPSTFGAAITRRAPAALPGERSGRDTTGTVLCPGGAEGPGGVSVSSPPPAGSPPDVDALRDTENCCPSVVPDVEDVLPDPLADPVFAALLAKATELMTRVADSQTGTISTMTMDDMTVIADVPKHLPLVHIQRQLMEVAEQKDLIVTCFNAHCGQGRLEGDYIPFCLFGDGKKGFSHLESGTVESNVLRETEVYLIDNANLIQEDHWRYFLEQVVYCRNRYEHSGLVCFILMGADRLAYGRNDPTLTTDGVLPKATLCRSALSDASSLTQLARLEFNWRVDLQKNGLDKSINFSGHYDNVSTYISTGAHSLNALAGEFKTTAITEFPGRGEVMLLTCYDTPSSLMPDAVDIHEFIAFKGQRMSPDYTPPDLYPQITKANLRYYIHF